MARFKQLCSPEEMRITESKDECVIELVWLHAGEGQHADLGRQHSLRSGRKGESADKWVYDIAQNAMTR